MSAMGTMRPDRCVLAVVFTVHHLPYAVDPLESIRDPNDLLRLWRSDRLLGRRVDQVAPIEVLVVQLGLVLGQTQKPYFVFGFDHRRNASSLEVCDLLLLALEGPADQVTVSFQDATGAVVHTETLGAQQAGNVAFAWDGKNEAGEYVAGQPLRMVVTATKNGQTSNPATATWTSIGGIQSPSNGTESKLVTGLGLLEPSAAIRLA